MHLIDTIGASCRERTTLTYHSTILELIDADAVGDNQRDNILGAVECYVVNHFPDGGMGFCSQSETFIFISCRFPCLA